MCKAYSVDLRKRVLDDLKRKDDKKAASELFNVGIATVYRWIRQQKEKGHVEPHRREFVHRKLDYNLLKKYVKVHPDYFLLEIAKHFSVTEQAIFYALKKLKITRKKGSPLQGAG
ncbi:MAG: transposase [Verrucomicrobia bacterium]|nr:transposase [Verrucomicrobiota bacterium]MBS0647452.1 transposase [Verrucomicrobiota bacterium]